MFFNKIVSKLLLIVSIMIIILLSSCNYIANVEISPKLLYIHFIDVGQGDCELIQYNNMNLLIDAGPIDAEDKVTYYLKKLGVKTIDYVVATHPHEDHIGGMNAVFNTFKVKQFITPKVNNSPTTNMYKQLLQTVKQKNLNITSPKSGSFINLGSNINCEILAPNGNNYDDLNNYSIVLKLIYGETKFLFVGDALTESENEMISAGYDLSCNVLKIGHHGSNSATSDEFLKNTSPSVAIISCGKGNEYGHPHKSTISKLTNINCKIFRTDLNGDIVLTSNGKNIEKINLK